MAEKYTSINNTKSESLPFIVPSLLKEGQGWLHLERHFNLKQFKNRRKALRRNLSKAEAVLWQHLSNRQLLGLKFRRQFSVDQYVLDFYCPELKLAIEVDGDTHFVGGAEVNDEKRQKSIELVGILFVRVTNDDILQNLDGVLQLLAEKVFELKKRTMKESHS